MKNIIKLTLILIICMIISIKITHASSIIYNDDGTIQLYAEDIINLKTDELNKVTEVTIKNEMPSQKAIEVLEKCLNIEIIYFFLIDQINLSNLNNINSSNKINFYIVSSRVDFENFNNIHIGSINIANSHMSNFKEIENISSIETLGIGETKGYEQIDYTKLPDLTTLTLNTYIEDFDKLTSSIPNVTELSLASSNIQNKDTIYLERLTNLKSLNLNQTYLTDIDFVEKLPNLEYLTLPWSVVDLSPIYSLDNLSSLYWEAYTELSVTQEFVNYLDSRNIMHYDYNSNVKEKINKIIKELNIKEETDTKKSLEKITKYIVENTSPDLDYQITSGVNLSVLDEMIIYKQGVCYGHSIALYTLAKAAGIEDVYGVSGILYTNIINDTGEDDGSLYGFEAHAWNIVDYNGVLYSIDTAQMNDGSFSVEDNELEENFWKNPLKDDEYDLNYAYANYLDFNYFYAKRHEETDGILKQTATFQFKDIEGLEIKNHTIYNYDKTDKNAEKLCSKVLDNYLCIYEDVDSNNKISTGDTITIKKRDNIVEIFTLSTSNWVKPVKPYLNGITIEYTNYQDIKITDSTISTLYYNKNNSLKIIIKGENYDENKTYKTVFTILNTDEDKTIHTKVLNLTGKEINQGTYITIEGGLLTAKEPPKEELAYGTCQYFISLKIDDEERFNGVDYIIEKPKEDPQETNKNEDIINKEVVTEEENPNTTDKRIVIIAIISLLSLIATALHQKKLKWLE